MACVSSEEFHVSNVRKRMQRCRLFPLHSLLLGIIIRLDITKCVQASRALFRRINPSKRCELH